MRKLFSIGTDSHGRGRVNFQWSPKGSHLATVGVKRKVYIWDRNGRLYDEIHLPTPEVRPVAQTPEEENTPSCVAIEWDGLSERLAIIPTGVNSLLLYTLHNRETTKVDTNMKELAFLSWAKGAPMLAVGTGKGNVLIYNDKLGKKVPIMGKHTRKITCGCWNSEGRLALGSEDRQVTISKAEGDTIRQLGVKMEPLELFFSDKKDEEKRKRKENTVSINVGRRTIYLYRISDEAGDADRDNPIELAFQERYGNIQCHRWFGDGYILIGFQTGYVVVISTHNKEMSEEIHSARYHKDNLTDVAFCNALDRAATCGGSSIKVIDMTGQDCVEIKSDSIEFDSSVSLDHLEWTQDGQVLSTSTVNGEVHSFLASLPIINDSYETRLVYLTSLLELSVLDVLTEETSKINIETEPAFVALGAMHVAVGMNNQALFYRVDPVNGSMRVNQRDYLGTVEEVKLNERFAAVLSEGRVQVHVIEAGDDPGEEEDLLFPDKGHAQDISCVGLTHNFLMFGTKRGSIHYFYLEDKALVNEYRHEDGDIRSIYPNVAGTRMLFVDGRFAVNLFNPVNDQVLPVPKFTGTLDAALWDAADPNVFVLADNRQFYVYVYAPVSIAGPLINFVGTTPRPSGHAPVLLYNGIVTCQLKSGSLERVVLTTHNALQGQDRGMLEKMKRRFNQHLGLVHLKEAWELALQLRSQDVWNAFTETALTFMELDIAVRAFRYNGNAGMVLSLQKIAQVEDKNLLAGHICVLLEQDYSTAQELFLKSSRPIAALEMRKDLKHWDHALKLAKQLDPEQLSEISREYAQLLEMRGEYEQALSCYEKALTQEGRDPRSDQLCQAGIARTTLHLGDIRRGRQLALESDNLQLCRECAGILESMNQLQDAAELYERGGQYEKAASIYIQTKSFSLAQPLMAKISTPKLHVQYARAKEAEGRFEEAAQAYEIAKDLDNVVRLQLMHLNNPQRAFALVRRARSAEGASLVAKFCISSGDYPAAIEFLLMARRAEEAFELAQSHDEMDTYVRICGDNGTPDEYMKLARYYENKGIFNKAGELYEKCDQFPQALKLYLRCGAAEIDHAINVVGRANNDMLTNQLVDFLMGETDGIQKDHNYLFRLHMALHQYEQAAHTAVLIARQEQEMGNYKLAHTQLFDTHKELENQNKKPPAELTRQLMLLHSYILVKTLVKLGDHVSAARMLIRVAKNISKFPRHVVPILTSTVIECQRAGFKKTAFEYASMLMRPEYRTQISAQYKRKIENIVRKPDKADEEEPMSECPFCQSLGPESDLECTNCKNVIPYCIATGRRMVVADWAACPSCRFPCRASVFVKIIAADKLCAMCNQPIVLSAIQKISDPIAKLKAQMAEIEAANEPPPAEEAES